MVFDLLLLPTGRIYWFIILNYSWALFFTYCWLNLLFNLGYLSWDREDGIGFCYFLLLYFIIKVITRVIVLLPTSWELSTFLSSIEQIKRMDVFLGSFEYLTIREWIMYFLKKLFYKILHFMFIDQLDFILLDSV